MNASNRWTCIATGRLPRLIAIRYHRPSCSAVTGAGKVSRGATRPSSQDHRPEELDPAEEKTCLLTSQYHRIRAYSDSRGSQRDVWSLRKSVGGKASAMVKTGVKLLGAL